MLPPGICRGGTSPSNSRPGPMRRGPTPETDPDGFRWTPDDRPVPVPSPLPEESPGGSWASNSDGKQNARDATKTAGNRGSSSAGRMEVDP